ncbi:MAG: hypothetical protein ACHQHO_01565 [Solirubrobacterales bacterium]
MRAERRPPRSAKVLACAAALALALLAPVAARAEPEWKLPPEQLTATLRTPQSWAPPVVAVGAEGEATALIVHWQAPGSTLVSVDRPPGGAWGSSVTVPAGSEPIFPQLATAGGGEQTAAWLDAANVGDPFTVWTSRRRAGEAWQAPVQMPLYGVEDHVVDGPAVAEDAAGDALVVWAEADSSYSSSWLVAAKWRAGAWGAPQRISVPAGFVRLSQERSVASDGPGEFVVGWIEEPALGLYSAEAETLAGEAWTGEQAIESGPDFLYGSSLDANAAGHAAMTWADASTETVHAASMTSGAWTASNPASTHIHVVCDEAPPEIGIDAGGTSRALWLEAAGRLTSERMSPGGGWEGDRQVLTTVPNGWNVFGMQLGVDGEGDALASWTTMQSASPWASSVQVASELAGGSWSPPLTLASGAGGYRSGTTLDFSREGFGVAAWLDELLVPEGEEKYDFTPRTVVFEGKKAYAADPVAATGGQIPTGSPTPQGRRRLGPVYVFAPRRRLWLARGGRTISERIRNTNPFPVSGTATIYEYFLAKGGTAHASSRRVATTVHYRLAAGQTAPISFRIGSPALRRLRAYVPDRGHILVSVRLSIYGEGQTASSSVVMALDQPMRRHSRHLRRPRIPRGYPAPVDPWAHKAC